MYRSVCIFVLVALSASAQVLADGSKLDKAEEQCAVELKIDPTVLTHGRVDISNNKGVSKEAAECYGTCTWKKRGHLNPDGTLNISKAANGISQHYRYIERAVEAVERCSKTVSGDSECKRGKESIDCINRELLYALSGGDWTNLF